MKPYGAQAQMEKGIRGQWHCYDGDMDSVRCYRNKRTRNNAMRYYRKVQRMFNKKECENVD